MAASRLYKRIQRHYAFMQIYEKKRYNLEYIDYKEIEDDDLFIDLKLDFKTEEAIDLFDLSKQVSDDSKTDKKRTSRPGSNERRIDDE